MPSRDPPRSLKSPYLTNPAPAKKGPAAPGPVEPSERFRSDLCFAHAGRSRVDDMDPALRARVVEMLEERGKDAPQRELRRRFYEIAGIAAGQKVIEVGCGTGVDTRALAALVVPDGMVLGVDLSETLLEEARRITPTQLPIHFRQMSGEKLATQGGIFDRALAITTLSHIEHPLPVVNEMARAVKPGGRVAILDHDLGTFIVDASDRETTRLIFERYTREVSGMDAGRRLRGFLLDAGLEGVRVEALPLVDIEFSSYFRFVVDRYPDRAIEDGLLTREAAEAWKGDVRARAARGRFFGSLVYFAAIGEKK